MDEYSNCQQSLSRGEMPLPWKDGDKEHAYITCPHYGHKNIRYGFGEDGN